MQKDTHILLVMDGECALCSWGARTITKHDQHDVFRITTVQSQTGRALLVKYDLEPDDPWSWLLVDQGQAYTGSDAMLHAGQYLSAPWNILAFVGRCIPRLVREPLYRWIAKNRIAWFGRGDLCALPDEKLRAKLID